VTNENLQGGKPRGKEENMGRLFGGRELLTLQRKIITKGRVSGTEKRGGKRERA